jgi:hypothetical protein
MELLVATCAVALLSSSAFAGVISSTTPATSSGPGLGLVNVAAVVTANIDNDNQVGGGGTDNNLVIPLKRFDFNDYIDIVFPVLGSNGTTEYKVTEFVDNNTGVNWSSYRMQLGFGTGAGFIDPATAGNPGLDFDAPGYDGPPLTSGALTTVATSPYLLTFSGGSQGTGAQQYTFRIDLPNLVGRESFTLRQFPTPVPEPTTVVMLGLVVCGLMAGRRAH